MTKVQSIYNLKFHLPYFLFNMFFVLVLFLQYKLSKPGKYTVSVTPGRFKLECKGAQGGSSFRDGNQGANGGFGAYTAGTMDISGERTFYVFIGGQGGSRKNGDAKGGYNGGGNAGSESPPNSGDDGAGGGGGATDVRLGNQTLAARIMVAAGGSGASSSHVGAPGGDTSGRYFTDANILAVSAETSQSSGNEDGVGGRGENVPKVFGIPLPGSPGGGGGGGYRGGKGGKFVEVNPHVGVGNSGSSYISGYSGCKKHDQLTFKDTSMIAGGSTTTNGEFQLTIIFNCSKNCYTCTSADVCTKCNTGYRRYNNKCYSKCPNGSYAPPNNNLICYQCSKSCKTCTGSNSKCTSCNANTFLLNNQCQTSCQNTLNNDKYGKNTNNWTCTKCQDTNCNNCLNNYQKCDVCNSGYKLYKSQCVPSCPNNTYDDNNVCKDCHSTCKSCTGNLETQCTSCKPNTYLLNNQCKSDCISSDNKYYGKNTNQHTCEICTDPNCVDCLDNFATCKTCRENYYLDDNGKCMTPTNSFSESNSFTNSVYFTKSTYFTESIDFTISSVFSISSNFPDSEDFTKSACFTNSNDFSHSVSFTKSKSFSHSISFTKSADFSNSVMFTKSSAFTNPKVSQASQTLFLTHTFLASNLSKDDLGGSESQKGSKSGFISYLIPMLCGLLVIAVFVILLLFFRRRKENNHTSENIETEMALQSTQVPSEILDQEVNSLNTDIIDPFIVNNEEMGI